MLAGIRDFVIVSDPHCLPQFEALLGDGTQWGISIVYNKQERPAGIVDGICVAENELRGFHVALMLGDNILYGSGLPGMLSCAVRENKGATVFSVEVADPTPFGIVELGSDGKPIGLVEKPTQPSSRLVPLHRGFDRLSVVHRRSGRCSGSTINSMLRAILGFLLMNPARSSVNTIW